MSFSTPAYDAMGIKKGPPFFAEQCKEAFKPETREIQMATGIVRLHVNLGPPSQIFHIADWKETDNECQYTTQALKALFFSTRRIAVSWPLANRLRNRNAADVWSDEDQAHALESIRSLVLAGSNPRSASGYLQLPQLLRGFAQLKVCTIMFNSMTGIEQKTEPYEMPAEFEQLLRAIGVPEDIEFKIEARPAYWPSHKDGLETNVYPMLKFKAEMLAKQREMA